MSSYIGRHAELYDLFYADKPYQAEAIFVHQCLQQYGIGETQRILELACGTGEHAFALEKFGYQILATDYSQDMLACAQRKAQQRASSLEFRWQDMRALDLPDAPFDAVICLFDSIGYVVTNAALQQVLQGVHHYLRPEGLLIFEFWHAAAMLRNYEPLRIRRWKTPAGAILRIAETSLQISEQLGTVAYTVYELRNDGTFTGFQETHVNRYFLVQEMAGWLSASGFTPVQWCAGFTQDKAITEQTWHIVAAARKVKN